MKHPKRKLIGGILLLLVLTGLFGGFLLISNTSGTIIHKMETRASMIKAVSRSLENDLQLSLSVGESIQALTQRNAAGESLTDEKPSTGRAAHAQGPPGPRAHNWKECFSYS